MKHLLGKLLIISFLWLLPNLGNSQTFVTAPVTPTPNTGFRLPDGTMNFNACTAPSEGYRMLSNVAGTTQIGLWNPNTIDLNRGFTLNFSIRYNNNPNGADGIAFVMQNQGTTALGGSGGWLGYGNWAGSAPISPSVAVEFDIFNNGVQAAGNALIDDIAADHTSVMFNGNMANLISGPTLLGPNNTAVDIEDGAWHPVQVIWDPCTLDFDVFFDGNHVVDMNNDLIANAFGGVGTGVTWGFTAGKASSIAHHDICIDPIVIAPCCGIGLCEIDTDLTACPEEGDFGYIAITNCGIRFPRFNWAFPPGATSANVISNGGSSVVYGASPGLYTVTIEYGNGCTETLFFRVEEDCCEPLCAAPENLRCIKDFNGNVQLAWDPVDGACKYVVEFNPRAADIKCECRPGESVAVTTEQSIIDIPKGVGECFTWRVTTICCDGTRSEPSEVVCFDENTRCLFIGLGNQTGQQIKSNTTIYPNPTNGTVNINLEIEEDESVEIVLFDRQGSVISKMPEQKVKAGTYKTSWKLDEKIQDGIYFLRIYESKKVVNVKKLIIQR